MAWEGQQAVRVEQGGYNEEVAVGAPGGAVGGGQGRGPGQAIVQETGIRRSETSRDSHRGGGGQAVLHWSGGHWGGD